MPSLIDKSYFVGSIQIDTSSTLVQSLLTQYISECEQRFLTLLMGEDLYYDYTLNTAVQKYKDLINGKVYTDQAGILKNYTGVKQMLAYFTYYYFLTDQKSFNTPLGDVSGTAQNAELALPIQKLNNAWNNGVNLYKKAQAFITYQNSVTSGTYPNYVATDLNEANQFAV